MGGRDASELFARLEEAAAEFDQLGVPVRPAAPAAVPLEDRAPALDFGLSRESWASGKLPVRSSFMSIGPTPAQSTPRLADAGVEIEREMAAQFGGAPTLAHYRQVYAACGVPWPGDDEIRRQLPVAAES